MSYSVLGMLLPFIINKIQGYSHVLNTENICQVYPAKGESKMWLVFLVIFLQQGMSLCIFRWPIRVWGIERIYSQPSYYN